ncbi:uncharacterized protein Z519_12150 [Cladophialophora bantiana CBS 173.52]|uniref:Uncharacterized protein n=1 Tax=Cladophialophora bantiana (strain ATCC 10958 / CBS 173.52 / CDC B-1940 / NIH 8579) TaxID=1442370 RepID=A0A0D2FKN0_CLAB1|nr:uncharacterized protein Z519_12150 [Cladophialophora bantiana CBS 173.52]KIW87247.1 hypothetical protein Z519_12150 [Cladophialophora bantiana CBS 173.52]
MDPRKSKHAFDLPRLKTTYSRPARGRFTFYDVKFWPYAAASCDGPIFAVAAQRGIIVGRLSNKSQSVVTILQDLWDFQDDHAASPNLNSCAWCYIDRQRPLLVVGGGSGQLKVVDVLHAQPVATLLGHGRAAINDIAVHPLYPWIVATASQDGALRVWDLRRHRLRHHAPSIILCGDGTEGHRAGVLSLAWHQTGRYLVSGGHDHRICVWTIPDLEDGSPFWDTVCPELVERRSNETFVIHCPHFVTQAVHTQYIDCARFFGDLLVTKAAVEGKIVFWKITGFDSGRCPPTATTAPKLEGHLDTRNGFMRTVITDKDGYERVGIRSDCKNKPPYRRLLEFETPHDQVFYMRFGLLLPSQAYPDIHPVLAFGNAASELRFWDLERLSVGHAGEVYPDAHPRRAGRKRKRPATEVVPTAEQPEKRPRNPDTAPLAPERWSSRLKQDPPATEIGNIETKEEVVGIRQGSAQIKIEPVEIRQESPGPISQTPPARHVNVTRIPSQLVSDVAQPSQETPVTKRETNSVGRSTAIKSNGIPPSPDTPAATTELNPVRRSRRLLKPPSPPASDGSEDRSRSRSPSIEAGASGTALPSPETSPEADLVRRSTRLKRKASNVFPETVDGPGDTIPAKRFLPSPGPGEESRNTTQGQEGSAHSLENARRKSLTPECEVEILASIEADEESSGTLEVEREGSASSIIEKEASYSVEFVRARPLALDFASMCGDSMDMDKCSLNIKKAPMDVDTPESRTSRMSDLKSSLLGSQFNSTEEGNKPSTAADSTLVRFSVIDDEDYVSINDPENPPFHAPDREKYPVDEPHMPLKSHARVVVHKLQYKKRAPFVARAVDWSPCGRWCIAVGESCLNQEDGWGGLAVLHRPDLPKVKMDDKTEALNRAFKIRSGMLDRVQGDDKALNRLLEEFASFMQVRDADGEQESQDDSDEGFEDKSDEDSRGDSEESKQDSKDDLEEAKGNSKDDPTDFEEDEGSEGLEEEWEEQLHDDPEESTRTQKKNFTMTLKNLRKTKSLRKEEL